MLRDRIEVIVCHLYVELRYPIRAVTYEGGSVRPLKSYMIWVHSVVRQEGFYLQSNNFLSVRKEQSKK